VITLQTRKPSLEVAPTTLLLIYSFQLRSAFQALTELFTRHFHLLGKGTLPPMTLNFVL